MFNRLHLSITGMVDRDGVCIYLIMLLFQLHMGQLVVVDTVSFFIISDKKRWLAEFQQCLLAINMS
jgi:hypothetical protein